MTEYEQFSELHVKSLDGDNAITINGMYKDMSVKRFKSAVASRLRDPNATAERIMLFSLGEEVEDDQTLRSYNMEAGDTITYVLSDRSSRPSTPGPDSKTRTTPARAAFPSINDAPPAYESTIAPPVRLLESIFIQDLNKRTHTIRKVPVNMTTRDLLVRWQENYSVDIDGLRLIYGGKQLDSERPLTLMDYGVNEGSTLFAVMRLQGGE